MSQTRPPAASGADFRTVRPPLERAAIVAVAREQIAKGGLESLSLRRVAAQLGVTAPSLYAHVESKDDLLRAVAEIEFGRLTERLLAIDAANPLDRIREGAWTYVTCARENPNLFELLFEFRPVLTSNPRGDELVAATRAYDAGAVGVRDAIASGQLRDGDPLETSLVFWTAIHGMATVVLSGAELGREREERIFGELIDSLLSGLAPR